MFGDCHGSPSGWDLLNQGSIAGGGCGFDSQGSTVGTAVEIILPFVAVGVELFCSQPSVDDPDAADGDWVRDIQLSTLVVPVGLDADDAPATDCHGSTGDVDVCDHGSVVG